MTRKKKNPNLEAARSRMYHDLIFDCAERVFAEKGFDESTMQDVASEAGISLKTLYATFPGKTDIYAEIQMTRGLAFLAAVREGAGEGNALERLEGGLRAFVDVLLAHEPFRRILLREGRTWGLNPATKHTREAWQAGIDYVARVVRRGIEEGVFHPGDPELLAGTVMAVMQVQLAGLLLKVGDDADSEAIVDEILVLLRRILCVDPTPEKARRVA
jgi:AcrR family transcriptional regulator